MALLNRFVLFFTFFTVPQPHWIFTLELIESKCPDVPRLDVVPGFGWDALTNKDMTQTLKVTYKQCKLTSDGKYIIPDGTDAVVIKRKELQLGAELIEHWSKYTSITAQGFKTGFGISNSDISLGFYYSQEYQNIKNLQVKYEGFTTRTQLQNLLYSVHIAPDAPLSDDLRDQIVEAMRYIGKNHTANAEYLLQMIVSNYGTHYTKSVDAGAILMKEDLLHKSFLHDHAQGKQKIVAAAKLSFLNVFDFTTANYNYLDKSLVSEYNNALIIQSKRSIGGPTFDSSLTGNDWLDRASENLVAIDRSGDFITSFLSPSKFPKAPPWLLRKTHVMLTKTIKDYYDYNTHKGCMKLNSPNFDYNANVDDGSCEALSHNYSFGGIYQECTQNSNIDKIDACKAFRVTNDLTGSFSCPVNFESFPLYLEKRSYTYMQNYPWEECSGWWLWKKCWHNDNWKEHGDYVYIVPKQCLALANQKLRQTNYQFGGLYSYSSKVTNINTGKYNCPPRFRELRIIGHGLLTICITNNIDSTNPYAMSFGGLASCKTSLQCPTGFFGHFALVYENCQINYCIHKADFSNQGKIPLLLRPPFINITEEIIPDAENEEYDDYGVPLRLQDLSDSKKTTIGIVVPLCILIALALIGLGYWRRSCINTYVADLRNRYINYNNQRSLSSRPNQRNDVLLVALPPPPVNSSSCKPLLRKTSPQVSQTWKSVNDELRSKNFLTTK